jgi:hypothetical protein
MDHPSTTRPARLAAIDALPNEMQDHALVDWQTVANLLANKDIEYARALVTAAGVPLVHVSERRKLPRWGALREWLRSREHAAEGLSK